VDRGTASDRPRPTDDCGLQSDVGFSWEACAQAEKVVIKLWVV